MMIEPTSRRFSLSGASHRATLLRISELFSLFLFAFLLLYDYIFLLTVFLVLGRPTFQSNRSPVVTFEGKSWRRVPV